MDIVVGVAAALAIPLGALVAGRPAASRPALAVTGTMLTIASFALFGLLTPDFGLGAAPAITALTLYAIFPIVRNTVTGARVPRTSRRSLSLLRLGRVAEPSGAPRRQAATPGQVGRRVYRDLVTRTPVSKVPRSSRTDHATEGRRPLT